MKILYVTTVPSTLNTFLIPHIEMLINQGHKVDIATSKTDLLKTNFKKMGCNIIEVPFSRNPIKLNNLKSLMLCKRILNSQDYDLVHTHTPVASFIIRLAAVKKYKNGMKIVYTAHGFHFYKGAPLKNWIIYYPMEKIMSYFTDILITINEEDYNFSLHRLSAKKNIKLPGVGVDFNKFYPIDEQKKREIRDNLGLRKYDVVLTYVAELNNNKNQKILIETIKILIKKEINVVLLLVGSGPNKNLYEQMLKDLNLTENVLLLGRRSDIPNILAATDIYLASSIREGLPINIIEALSVGLPIVASNNRGHRELVIPNKNGYLISGNNAIQYAEKISHLLDNPNLQITYSNNSKLMAKKYDLKEIINMLTYIY